jgi:hypothetical protein
LLNKLNIYKDLPFFFKSEYAINDKLSVIEIPKNRYLYSPLNRLKDAATVIATKFRINKILKIEFLDSELEMLCI